MCIQNNMEALLINNTNCNIVCSHTEDVSVIPISINSSLAERAVEILLTSLFRLFKSDLYSLNLARSMPLEVGCRLLASRSIFLI